MLTNDKLRSLPRQAGVDVLVAMSPENFAYVGGTHIITVKLLPSRHAYAVIPRDREPILLVCSIEESLAREESWIKDVRTYTEFKDDPVEMLAKLLTELGLDRGKLGIDLSYLPQLAYARLVGYLPNIQILDTTDAVVNLRAVKTDDEVAIVENATKTTHAAVLKAMEESRLGETEKTMANRIANGMITNGADGTLFICFGSGPRSMQAHPMANDRIPKESEIIRFDVGGTYKSWNTDFARTYSTGNPTAVQKETYRALAKVQKETIEFVKPGITAEDVFFYCKESFSRHGLKFHMPHVGHSFGIELHENPMLRPGDKTKITPGMVFNVEPLCFDGAGGGFHLEDLLVVTDKGNRLLTNGLAPRELPVIGMPLSRQI